MKNEKIVLWIMVVGILCIVITPYLFTHLGFGVDFTSANTNNIGGTIGGITAPFTGILGSLLVYYALQEQVKANKLIQKQLDEQKESDDESKVLTYLKKQLDIIKKDIDSISYVHKETLTVNGIKTISVRILKGSDAINKYIIALAITKRHHGATDIMEDIYQLTQIKNLLTFIDQFVKLILFEKISEKDRVFLLNIIKYLFESKINIHFDYYKDHKSSNLVECSVCQQYHNGIPDELYEILTSINSRLQL